jgi:hypothetical protein
MLSVDFIWQDFFVFQQPSVVLLFKEVSFWLIAFLAASAFISFVLQRLIGSPNKRIIQLVIYPFLIIGAYLLLAYVLLPFIGLDSGKLNLSDTISAIISYWYFFLIFPAFSMLMKLPFKFMLTNNEYFQGAVLPGIFEEISYRFFLINSLFMVTKSLEISIFVGILIFSLAHIFQQAMKGFSNWSGLFAINNTLLVGIIDTIVALQYGLIFSIIIHILHNAVAIMTSKGNETE